MYFSRPKGAGRTHRLEPDLEGEWSKEKESLLTPGLSLMVERPPEF